jgi:hypothetical protein
LMYSFVEENIPSLMGKYFFSLLALTIVSSIFLPRGN